MKAKTKQSNSKLWETVKWLAILGVIIWLVGVLFTKPDVDTADQRHRNEVAETVPEKDLAEQLVKEDAAKAKVAERVAKIEPLPKSTVPAKYADNEYAASSYSLGHHYGLVGVAESKCGFLGRGNLAHLAKRTPDDWSDNDDRFDIVIAANKDGKADGRAAAGKFIEQHGQQVFCDSMLAVYGPGGTIGPVLHKTEPKKAVSKPKPQSNAPKPNADRQL